LTNVLFGGKIDAIYGGTLMKIVIIGAGEAGFRLAQRLSTEHDVTVIEPDNERRMQVESQLDVLTVLGSGTSVRALREAHVGEADLVVVLTDHDEINILACMMASILGAKTRVARLRDPGFIETPIFDYRELGIDLVIYPEKEVVDEAIRLLRQPPATDIILFPDKKTQLVSFKVIKDAPVVNRTIADVAKDFEDIEFRVVAINRGEKTIIPKGADTFEEGDKIFVVEKVVPVSITTKLEGEEAVKLSKVLILGGGRIGTGIAHELEEDKEISIKLIESNKEKTQLIAETLKRTLVLQGDGTDVDLLAQEGISDIDALLAMTDDDETNILTCLYAKHLNVKKVIALIRRFQYFPLTPRIGIDAGISTIQITINAILRFLHRGRKVISATALKDLDAEILELEASRKSKVTKRPLKGVNFPKDAIVGAIIRNDHVIIPTGETQINPDDTVAVFTMRSAIEEVERMFE
jgi:trk system potassium uptake protein TrkA